MCKKYYPVLLFVVFLIACNAINTHPKLVAEGFTVDSSLDTIQFLPVSHPYQHLQDEGNRANFVRKYTFAGYDHVETMDFIVTLFDYDPLTLYVRILLNGHDRRPFEIQFSGSYIDYQCGYDFPDTATVMTFNGHPFIKKHATWDDSAYVPPDSSSLTINRIPVINQIDTLIGRVYARKQLDNGGEISYSGTFRVVIYPERWGFDAEKID